MMSSDRRLAMARVLSFVVVVAITVYIFSIRDKAEQFAAYGYPGIFIISFLAYATVFLPAPGIAVVFTMGAVFHPMGVALAAGAGAATGELTGYLAGFSGQAVIERTSLYSRMTQWIDKNGALTVLLLAAIPNPFFDIAGVVAGILKMPLLKFLIWCWLGETLKMCAFAYLGSSSLSQLF